MRSKLICATTLIIALSAVMNPALADDAEVQKLRSENAALKARVAELESELAMTKTAADEATKKAADAERQAAAEREAMAKEKAAIEQEQRAYHIERRYDAAADRTTITSRATSLKMLKGAPMQHWLSFSAGFAGQSAGAVTDPAAMVIQTSLTGTRYRSAKSLTLTIDGAPHPLAVTGYDSVVRRLGSSRSNTRRDDETVTVELPIETLRAIAGAATATGIIAGTEFALTADHRAAAAAMIKEIETQ